MTKEEHKVIINGSGPAGATAALYLARAGYFPIVLHGDAPGGQLTMIPNLENFPGWQGNGSELVETIESQAIEWGAEFRYEIVTKVDLRDTEKIICTDNGNEYISRCLIIATGTKPLTLGLPNETRLIGRVQCAMCDGPLYKGRRAVVVGGGNVACREALFLSKLCSSVTLIHDKTKLHCQMTGSSVDLVFNSTVIDILGENRVSGIRIKNNETKQEATIACDVIFISIGHSPSTKLFSGFVDVDKEGYFITDGSPRTNVEGVFVAGECASPEYRQAILSAAAGARAALLTERMLSTLT